MNEKRKSLLEEIRETLKDLKVVDTRGAMIRNQLKRLRITAIFYCFFLTLILIGLIIEWMLGMFKWYSFLLSWFFPYLVWLSLFAYKGKRKAKNVLDERFHYSCYMINFMYLGYSIFLFTLNKTYLSFPWMVIPIFIFLGSLFAIICIPNYVSVLKKLMEWGL